MDCYSLQSNIRSDLISQMDSSCASNQKNCLEKEKFITDLSLILKEIDVEKCHVPKFPSLLYTIVYHKDKVYYLTFLVCRFDFYVLFNYREFYMKRIIFI